MEANPYLAPVANPSVKHRPHVWALSAVCVLLATYCGIFCVGAVVAAFLTQQPLWCATSGVSELGMLAWILTGLSIGRGWRLTGVVAGMVGLGVLFALAV